MSTSRKRYAVVSCHVERLLDDRVWEAYAAFLERCPGGFAVASIVRPPDPDAGESVEPWLERARRAASHGPLGHHTHWTSPTHARPTVAGESPGLRVSREAAWLREQGLAPTLFCGGGWYTDAHVAEACAAVGYADCTPRATRPSYLRDGEPWAQLGAPARVVLPSGARLTVVPTTHTVGDLVRGLARPRGLQAEVVHVYFHDTDLLDARRTRALGAALRVLALRRAPARLDAVALRAARGPHEVAWSDVARGGSRPEPQ